MKDSQEEVFLMSDQIVTELQEAVVEHIGEMISFPPKEDAG
jgi:hypothetical protein